VGLAAAVLLGSWPARRAAAADALFTPSDCSTANLLARRLPWARQDMRGNLALVTDEAVGPEGAQWDAPVGVTFETPAGSLTYDLGSPTVVSAIVVQADANDDYKVLGSLDGTPDSFRPLTTVENVLQVGHGLRTRALRINPTMVRFLRIGEPVGDNYYSISEFEAFCQVPATFPPKLRVVDAPPAKVPQLPWYRFSWWDNDTSSRFEMVLAIAALALVGWGIQLGRKGLGDYKRRLRSGLLIAVGALSFGAYFNFGSFHFPNRIHWWDAFHYYVGSKYFSELSYDRLYECVAVADAEDPSLRRRVELRKIMNLRTNMMGPTTEILAHPERCKDRFTPERWQGFKKDIELFRVRLGVKRWEDAQTDHGYNATPVWNILGTILTNVLGPATDGKVEFLTAIDLSFIVGISLLTWWAFGWRTMCVALAVLATNFPSRYYWTGGSILRWDWLFYLVAGICFVRKERPLIGGFLLGYSALLRVFPVLLFIGPVLVMARQLWGKPAPEAPWWKPEPVRTFKELWGRLDRRFVSLAGGAALAVAVLFPISLVTSSGIDGWIGFRRNSEKHLATPLTNYMGLRTVVIYKPSEAGKVLRSDKLEDPWGAWKQAKLRTFHDRRAIFVLVAAAFVVLLGFALRDAEPWVACSMGAMMIAVGVELTCYYYAFLFAVALLYEKRQEAGAALLAITAITGFIDWAPIPSMPGWLDERYMWMSIFTLIGFGWVMFRFAAPDGARAFLHRLGLVDAPKVAAATPAPAAPAPVASDDKTVWSFGGGSRRRNKSKRK
jgi:hypothetical protein